MREVKWLKGWGEWGGVAERGEYGNNGTEEEKKEEEEDEEKDEDEEEEEEEEEKRIHCHVI